MAIDTSTAQASAGPGQTALAVIDADVHIQPTPAMIKEYLPQRWQGYVWGNRYASQGVDLVRARRAGARLDAWPPGGGPPGSDPAFAVEQLLDPYDISYAIANMIAVGGGGAGPLEYVAAVCRAANEWWAEVMPTDRRWLGSINLPYDGPAALAVKEIEHWASNPGFVQVMLSMRTEQPLGHPRYWDIFEACEAHDLAVAIHPGPHGCNTVTGSGWPSFYFEDHSGFTQSNPVHVANLIFEGVFDRFPKLKFVIVEGGWGWVPSLCWRLDASWRVMRSEVPDLQRRPSEYVREHVWYTTQPMEEPENAAWMRDILDRSGVIDRLMFSSDYPHWDFDSPTEALPRWLAEETRRKILYENACDLYGLSVDDPPAPA